jgi:ribosome maturation factor RimP
MRVRRRSREGPPFLVFRSTAAVIVSNPAEQKVAALLEPALADLGYRFVRVRLSGMRRKRLQIMAERISDGGMGLEDCERLSRAISPVLDANDPISGEYDLEISSPGIDRPLVREEDFSRFAGHEAKLELSVAIDGRRKFRGNIAAAEPGQVAIALPEGPVVSFPFAHVGEARLMLTDRLIEEDLKRARLAPLPEGMSEDDDDLGLGVDDEDGDAVEDASRD